tara:strand:+ start:47 stop:241 length:195 start_codon:yes stop_codon:yes gene_type:complete
MIEYLKQVGKVFLVLLFTSYFIPIIQIAFGDCEIFYYSLLLGWSYVISIPFVIVGIGKLINSTI